MGKQLRVRVSDIEELNQLGKALSSPMRIQILQLINSEKMSIAEIAKKLGIPASSAARDIKILENADLIKVEVKPGSRGNVKMCVRTTDSVSIRLLELVTGVASVASVEMPIGNYTGCQVESSCGIANEYGILEMDDMEQAFYLPERTSAQILWSAKGYVEYTFPNKLNSFCYKCLPRSIIISAEICSEAAGYKEDWKSDITLWVNGVECGTWISPGDFGKRRGRLTPAIWGAGRTQYGMLVIWEIKQEGCYINGSKAGETTIDDLRIMDKNSVLVRIGNKEDAVHVGGFNLFGKKFGDYEQDIIMSISYSEIA
ncbi:MAG: helix-turn-helix domain-containing protein [Lachnospiraceae bacterium]|nr:helix-turn-helix domain-containing protein [Lachnospiraceae bacterium]